MTAALRAEGLHTYYGKSHILHGVEPRRRRRQDHRAARPQRRRQDHDAAQPHGPDAGARGPRHDFRHTTPPAGRRSASPRAGVGYVPEGRRIFANLSVEENLQGAAASGRGPWTIERIYELFPAARRAQAQPRPPALRRRAGNALDRPRAAAQSQAADPGRAVAGAGAADRARGVPDRLADARGRAFRSCWSSRTPA